MDKYSYTSFEPQPNPNLPQLGTEVAASFVPGLNVAQALRDYARAAKENKYVDMGLSMLGMIPGAGAAVKTAHLLPLLLRNNDEVNKAAKASMMVKQGAISTDIWDKLKLFQYPRYGKNINQAHWGIEVPPGQMKMSGQEIAGAAPHDDFTNLTLADVLDAPELYSQVPKLSKVLVRQDDPANAVGRAGSFNGAEVPQGIIKLNTSLSPDKLPSVLYHETNHAINKLLGQNQTLGYVVRPLSEESTNRLLEVAHQLRMDPRKVHIADLLETLQIDASVAGKQTPEAYRNTWGRSMGERLAEADAYRSGQTSMYRDAVPPTEDIKHSGKFVPGLNVPLRPDDLTAHGAYAASIKSDAQETLKYLLEFLRNKYHD